MPDPIFMYEFPVLRTETEYPDGTMVRKGYKLLPGARVHVFFWNSDRKEYIPAGAFFEPCQGIDEGFRYLHTFPQATTDLPESDLMNVSFKFVNDPKVLYFDRTSGMIEGAPDDYVSPEASGL